MKRATTLIALLLLPLLILAGCSSGGNSTSGSSGTLSVGAVFPENGQSGKIGTAQLDTSTTRIKVEVIPTSGVVFTPYNANYYNYGSYSLTGLQTRNLTAASPTTTFSNLPIGSVLVLITSFDSTGKALDQVKAAGVIVEGSNTLTATMMRGNWTFNAQIALNKTMSTDTSTLSGFGAVAVVGMPNAYFKSYTTIGATLGSSLQSSMYWGGTPLATLLHGNFSNFTTACKGPRVYSPTSGHVTVAGWNSSTMCGAEGHYENYFRGITNLNSIEGADIGLKPDMTYPKGIWPGDRTNRWASIMGIYSSQARAYVQSNGTYSMTFSDPGILTAIQTNYTRATGGSAISGTLIEGLTKWYSSSRRCYNGATEVTCNPQQYYKTAAKASPGRKYQSALASALWKRMSGIGTAAADGQGCYRDLNVTSYEEFSYQQYTGYDPNTQQSTYVNITEKSTDFEKVDACLVQFTASGAQATTADVSILNQMTEFFFGQPY